MCPKINDGRWFNESLNGYASCRHRGDDEKEGCDV